MNIKAADASGVLTQGGLDQASQFPRFRLGGGVTSCTCTVSLQKGDIFTK